MKNLDLDIVGGTEYNILDLLLMEAGMLLLEEVELFVSCHSEAKPKNLNTVILNEVKNLDFVSPSEM